MAIEVEHIDFIMLKSKHTKGITMNYVCESNVCYTATKNID
jgi:hypothetical protein